jgi:hypothetical protein
MVDAVTVRDDLSSGPVRIEVRPTATGLRPPGWEDGVTAAARWAVESGVVESVDWAPDSGEPSPGDDGRWTLEIAPEVYPAPTMLARLVTTLLEQGGGTAEPRLVPIDAEPRPCRLVRPGGGAGVTVPSAVAFRDVRFDVDGAAVPTPVRPPLHQRNVESPFLTVIVRTQGRRPVNLDEVLTCLAAQTIDDFDVQLAVHDPSPAVTAEVVEQVGRFAGSFVDRVHVFQVLGAGRARPLNDAIERAAGDYVAFLDDDDLVTADWVEAFAESAVVAPGTVLRGVALNRSVRRTPDAGYEPAGPLERLYPASFDLLEHIHENATPIFSYAVPRRYLCESGTRFCESLPVLEDWDFLLRVAIGCGVHDTGRSTGIYHRWVAGESALQTVPAEVWQTARRRVLERLDSSGLVLPPGSASRLASLVGELRRSREEAASLRDALGGAEGELNAFRRSHSWRITAPLRWVSARLRR